MGAVTDFQFAIGDGVQTAFTLVDPSGAVASAPAVTAIYRTDWQDRQLLYATSRTNNYLQSVALGTAPNVVADATITGASGIAPDGTNTAWKLAETGTTAGHQLSQPTPGFVNLQPATRTVYLKAVERTWALVQIGGFAFAYINLTTGAVGNTVGSPTVSTKLRSDGWVKVTITATSNVTGPGNDIIWTSTGNGVFNFAGTVGSGILIWHPQTEAGSVGTSDIPTTAAAGTVTDYSVAGSVATLAVAPIAGATLAWTGTDSNGPFIPGHAGLGASSTFGGMGAR